MYRASWLFRTLEELMGWNNDESMGELKWLRLMARVKFDGYQDYVAGVRFMPSLVAWLQQFETLPERRIAYDLVRHRLTYISPPELRRLVELFFPTQVHHELLEEVKRATGVPKHRYLVDRDASSLYRRLLRRTLFLGLSDGARLDIFRRANVESIVNDQVVIATQLDEHKWKDLLGDLRETLQDGQATFRAVYLIDDFTASGTSLIRGRDGVWKGKIIRFLNSIGHLAGELFDEEWRLFVHHYIAGPGALAVVKTRAECAAAENVKNWRRIHDCTAGIELPPSAKVTRDSDPELVELAMKYYNSSFENKHTKEGEASNVALGFAGCALPLILDHNTPNNSLLLLWGDTEAEGHPGPPVRPLFRRRQRHS